MRKCIYCDCAKENNEFDTDHVMPESFGTFEDSFTLKNVCINCNGYFGSTIENVLARDSFFGVLYRSILSKNHKFKIHNKNLCDFYIFEDGEYQLIDIIAIKETEDWNRPELIIKTANQIKINNSTKGIERCYRINKLPHRRFLEDSGLCPRHGYIKFYYQHNEPLEKINTFMIKSDINIDLNKYNFHEVVFHQPKNKISFESLINEQIYRAISKIGFNYFTYHYSVTHSLDNSFDKIRKFIRHGENPSYRIANVINKNLYHHKEYEKLKYYGKIDPCHIVIINTKQYPKIIAQVTLFNELIFQIIINNKSLLKLPSKSSVFNLKTRKIKTYEF